MTFIKDDPRINRDGRPKGVKNFTTKVKEALEKIAEGQEYTYEEALIKAILKRAIIDGDSATLKLIWNYLDGMPKQTFGFDDDFIEGVKIEIKRAEEKNDSTDPKHISI